MNALMWAVPVLPAAAGGVLAAGRPSSRKVAVTVTLAAAALTLVVTLTAALPVLGARPSGAGALDGPQVQVPYVAGTVFGLHMDPLAAVVGVAVAVVALLVLAFAAVDQGPAFARFGGLMLLFVAAVLVTLTATTLPTLIVAWEVMGATSYALIGFDWHRRSAVAGGTVAFVTTRTADLGLYVAAGAALAGGAGLALSDLSAASAGWRTVIAVGVTVAALGKAAQLPFAFWISRAMEGPSPVSALLHSAAMVAMGGYLLLRVSDLLAAVPHVAVVTAWVGALTAVALGVVAAAQTDLKQVLAASTSAQLGFVVLAAGVGGVTAGTLQLVAHAATKALLFLVAGAWLSTLGTKQLEGLYGVARRQRVVGGLATLGLVALAGVAPLSLWASKEAVLSVALERSGPALYAVGLVGAVLSAVYAGRVLKVMWTPAAAARPRGAAEPDTLASDRSPLTAHPTAPAPRVDGERATRGSAASPRRVAARLAVVAPMALLALGAATAGLLAFPPAVSVLGPALGDRVGVPAAWELGLSAALAVAVVAAAWRWPPRPLRWAGDWLGLERLAVVVLVRPVDRVAGLLARFDERVLDRTVDLLARQSLDLARVLARLDLSGVDRGVEAVGRAARRAGQLVRTSQTGRVWQYYLQSAAVLTVAAVVLVWIG